MIFSTILFVMTLARSMMSSSFSEGLSIGMSTELSSTHEFIIFILLSIIVIMWAFLMELLTILLTFKASFLHSKTATAMSSSTSETSEVTTLILLSFLILVLEVTMLFLTKSTFVRSTFTTERFIIILESAMRMTTLDKLTFFLLSIVILELTMLFFFIKVGTHSRSERASLLIMGERALGVRVTMARFLLLIAVTMFSMIERAISWHFRVSFKNIWLSLFILTHLLGKAQANESKSE